MPGRMPAAQTAPLGAAAGVPVHGLLSNTRSLLAWNRILLQFAQRLACRLMLRLPLPTLVRSWETGWREADMSCRGCRA